MIDQAHFQAQAVEMARIQAHYLLREGHRLTVGTDLPQAVELIRDCLRHLHQPALAISFALGFHTLVETWAAWPAWIPALDMVLALDRQYDTPADEIRLLNHRSQAAREIGDYPTALATATKALHLAEALQDEALIAVSLNKLGQVAFSRDDLVGARAYWEQAYSLGNPHLQPLELGHISMNLGMIAVQQGRFADAHRQYQQALQHYRTQNDQVHMAKVECNLADLLLREGDMQAVPQRFLDALEVLQRSGARYNYALAQNDLGYFYLNLEQWEAALHAFQVAAAEFEQLGALSSKARVLSNIAELYVTTKQWDKAVPVLKEARELALMCEKPLFVAAIDVDCGRMLAEQGDYRGARRIWEKALVVQLATGALLAAQHSQAMIDALPGGRE